MTETLKRIRTEEKKFKDGEIKKNVPYDREKERRNNKIQPRNWEEWIEDE